MENITLTLDELNKMPKNAIALLYIQMSESFTILSAQSQKIQDQNERLIHQIEDLQEQIAILTQQRFGKRTETDKQVMGQLRSFCAPMLLIPHKERWIIIGHQKIFPSCRCRGFVIYGCRKQLVRSNCRICR